MATIKKEPELPLEPVGPAPKSSEEIEFDVRIKPWVSGDQVLWQWEVADHTHKTFIGDWTALRSQSNFYTADEAESDAKRMIDNARHVIGVKLTAPGEYRIKL